jgi:ubiquinol-cytochrome c reductase cytochrome b subunit
MSISSRDYRATEHSRIQALVAWIDARFPIRYRGWLFKAFLFAFAVSFIVLGYLGLQPPTPGYTNAARIFAIIYFAFFILMPWYSKADQTKPVPDRVTYHAH